MPLDPTSEGETAAESGAVLFLSGDLVFASRVRAAATEAGLEFRLAANLPEACDGQVRFVVLDLSTRSSLAESLVGRSAELCPNAKLIAYGPHVQVGRLETARQSGIGQVMTRGQFDRVLSSLFHEKS